MRLDKIEKEALKYSLRNFKGEVYLFGSRLDDGKKGGDIDIIVIPDYNNNPLKISLEIQKNFFLICEQNLDVIVYRDDLFCREILKNAEKIDITGI